VIFEFGWDQLHSSENTSIHDNISAHFGNIWIHNKTEKNTIYPKMLIIRKTPPPIPPRLSKEQMESLKKRQEACLIKGKSSLSSPIFYAQTTNSMASILKIKEAFPALPNKKILEIHNAAFPNQTTKNKKYNIPQRAHPENRLLYPPPTKSRILS